MPSADSAPRPPPAPAGVALPLRAGSYDGCVYVWDALTGAPAARLALHRALVRDASWHPTAPGVLATVSWDGSVCEWGPGGGGDGDTDAERIDRALDGDQMY